MPRLGGLQHRYDVAAWLAQVDLRLSEFEVASPEVVPARARSGILQLVTRDSHPTDGFARP